MGRRRIGMSGSKRANSRECKMVMKRAFLFATLCLSLAMGESVLVRSGYPRLFSAGQQAADHLSRVYK